MLVERLHHGCAYRLPADEHGDVAWGEDRPVAVAVDLLEYQPQHRGANEGLTLAFGGQATVVCEVVGVEKGEEIVEGGEVLVWQMVPLAT